MAEDLDSLLLMTGSTCLGKLTVEAEHLPAPERTQQTTTVHKAGRAAVAAAGLRGGPGNLPSIQPYVPPSECEGRTCPPPPRLSWRLVTTKVKGGWGVSVGGGYSKIGLGVEKGAEQGRKSGGKLGLGRWDGGEGRGAVKEDCIVVSLFFFYTSCCARTQARARTHSGTHSGSFTL